MIDISAHSNSGDIIEINSLDNKTIVRKRIFKSIDRAELSIKKQQSFEGISVGSDSRIEAVKIIEVHRYEHCLEILMPYVEGVVAADYSLKGTKSIGENVSKSLSLILYHELASSVDAVLDLNFIKSKIIEIKENTLASDYKCFFSKTCDFLDAIEEDIVYPSGPCHGDLTLSNIILSTGGGVKLIDFLDSYIETPLQDVAKIRQEFDFLWSFRKLDEPSRIKAKIFCANFFPRAVIDMERIYPLASRIFSHMALIRICPYVKDGVTKEWLINSLNVSMKKLKDSL